jgi:hypothetical protein
MTPMHKARKYFVMVSKGMYVSSCLPSCALHGGMKVWFLRDYGISVQSACGDLLYCLHALPSACWGDRMLGYT